MSRVTAQRWEVVMVISLFYHAFLNRTGCFRTMSYLELSLPILSRYRSCSVSYSTLPVYFRRSEGVRRRPASRESAGSDTADAARARSVREGELRLGAAGTVLPAAGSAGTGQWRSQPPTGQTSAADECAQDAAAGQ